MSTPGKGERAAEPVVNQDIDDQPHTCGYCGTRTNLDDATYYATGDMNHTCPHCAQRYKLTEEDEDGLIPLDGEGEIEILDEDAGEVIGMTKATEDRLSALDGVLADLAPVQLVHRTASERFACQECGVMHNTSNWKGVIKCACGQPYQLFGDHSSTEASLGDLDHLFGKAPSPYGDDFGSF